MGGHGTVLYLPRRQERPCSCPEGGSTCHRVVFYLLTSAATAYAEGVWVLWEGWFSEGAGDSWAALGSDVSQWACNRASESEYAQGVRKGAAIYGPTPNPFAASSHNA